MHRLTKAQARRIAVRAQLLDAPRPTDLLGVVQRLTLRPDRLLLETFTGTPATRRADLAQLKITDIRPLQLVWPR